MKQMKKFKSDVLRRCLSMTLALIMVIGAMPLEGLVSYGTDKESVITDIYITRTFDGKNFQALEKTVIEISGYYLHSLIVKIEKSQGDPVVLKSDNVLPEQDNPYKRTIQYTLTSEDMSNLGGVGSNLIIENVKNGGRFSISDADIPTLDKITPPDGTIKTNQDITIEGDNFNKINKSIDDKKTMAIFHGPAMDINILYTDIHDNKIVKKLGTHAGNYRVSFTQETTDSGRNINVTRRNLYSNLFRVHGELNVSDDIKMSPNQGAPGTEVRITGTSLMEDMSVFFLENIGDNYDIKNMGTFVRYRKDAEGTLDELIVKVPNLPQGTYRVVLTNKVNPGQDPNSIITSTKTFDNNVFVIINASNEPYIREVVKNTGPSSGIRATVRGKYLGSISKSIFTLNKGIEPTLNPSAEVTADEILDSLVVTYGDGSEVIGRYTPIRPTEGGIEVVKLERKIEGFIGNPLKFAEGSKLSVDGWDDIEVQIPPFGGGKNPEDVTLEITTTITYKFTNSSGMEEEDTITLNERVTKEKAFTYEPEGYEPIITAVTPGDIPVYRLTGDVYKTLLDGMRIALYGENFSIYRYEDKDEEGRDIVKYKYPIINIGGQITLNKNQDNSIDIKIFDKNGNEVDGSKGNDIGSKMVISIPKDLPNTGLNQIGPVDLNIQNPLRNSNPADMGSYSNSIKVNLVNSDKEPTISTVEDNVIPTDGQKGIIITGDNFDIGVKVYIDGELVKSERESVNKIIFDAPPRAEGYYQILVQNENGAAAIYSPFTYVKTYTNPKITDFSPKKGSENTIVTVTGKDFVLPNPLVKDLSGMGIWKLIGTRVILGGKDVNTYNGSQTEPELSDYTSPTDNLIINNIDGRLVPSDYYHSVILQEGISEPKFYTIYLDSRTGRLILTDGDKDVYVITTKGSGFVGTKGGKEYELEVTDSSLKIKDGDIETTLMFKTPYAVKDGIIVGNRVNIISSGELVFKVPFYPQPGYKDLVIMNPDRKIDAKVGTNGFDYTLPSADKPVISRIEPNDGSIHGGYFVTIYGSGFKDLGVGGKTSVTIGTVTVGPNDVEISSDGNSLSFKVPKYPGNLIEETDLNRKSVTVTVVNPNGNAHSMRDGFTYIIPTSNPKILGIYDNKGSAAGGDTITIEGDDFRFYEKYDGRNEGEDHTDLNGNGEWDDLRYWDNDAAKERYEEFLKEEDGWEKKIVPILPKVYFNGVQVDIKHFGGGERGHIIEIETPKGIEGPIEIYLVNNDHGISNKVIFTYESTNPKIDSIRPPVGRRQGNMPVSIDGSNFHESKVKVLKIVGDKVEQAEQPLQIVQFGDPKNTNISNRDIPIDAPQNSGRIRDKQATVKVGSLTVRYDATTDDKKLHFSLEEGTGENKKVYELNDVKYNDGEVFLPTSLLKGKDEKDYNGYEYVRIMLERVPGANITNRLRVDRGFSPNARLESSNLITLRTPSYYTVGTVPVIVTNPDGGKATINYEYRNPDSKPQITNVTRDGQQPELANNGANKILTVNMKGGSTITITGSDFRDVEFIQIGNIAKIESKDILINEPNRLVFNMPAVGEGALINLHNVVVVNEDGGAASSAETRPIPIYIQFIKGESNPQIESITPPRGPASGGTTVIIKGKDFRETMEGYEGKKLKVYFDGQPVPEKDVKVIDHRTISVIVPPGIPGSVEVKVENPDGEMSNTVEYTYASNPKITAVVDPLDPSERANISVISILGGQEIKLKGSGFMEGAKVYFVPKVTPGSESEGGNIIYIEGNPYILEEGKEGTDYKWINSETVTIKTPPGKSEEFGVIIVNPDGGASPIFINLTYGLPEIAAPSGVVAELVYDRFIRVHWNGVSGATEYEIFVVIDDKTTELIGSTELTSFAYNDLKPRTSYKFIVKAVGDFGSSKPSMESNTVRTGSTVGPPDEDGALSENTTMNKTGNTANVVIGTNHSGIGDIVIDLTRGNLAGSTQAVISIPASVVVNDGNRNIRVIGKDFSLQLQPSAFNVASVRENSRRSDAGVRFTIAPDTGNTQVPSGNQLSTVYKLDASVYVGNANAAMDYLAKSINFALNYDVEKANLRKLNKAEFNYFDPVNNGWSPTGGYINMVNGVTSAQISRLGRYTIIGRR